MQAGLNELVEYSCCNMYILTCIRLWRRLFRVTLEISCTVINLAYSRVPRYCDVTAGTLTATDTYAVRMHMCGFE
jgi:hypothetical protein